MGKEYEVPHPHAGLKYFSLKNKNERLMKTDARTRQYLLLFKDPRRANAMGNQSRKLCLSSFTDKFNVFGLVEKLLSRMLGQISYP